MYIRLGGFWDALWIRSCMRRNMSKNRWHQHAKAGVAVPAEVAAAVSNRPQVLSQTITNHNLQSHHHQSLLSTSTSSRQAEVLCTTLLTCATTRNQLPLEGWSFTDCGRIPRQALRQLAFRPCPLGYLQRFFRPTFDIVSFHSLKGSPNASPQQIAMSGYLKETLASVPQYLQSFQSLQVGPYLRNVRLPQVRLPQVKLPQTDFQGRASKLHSRNPKAFVIFLVLLFLFFWKDIIYNVCTHIAVPHKALSVVDDSPIRNSTLGVSSIPFILSVRRVNQVISFKIFSCSHCPNEGTGESPS